MKKMKEINILHLSDLHFGVERAKKYNDSSLEKREEAFSRFVSKLRTLDYNWKPNIAVISGDIAFSGDLEEFKHKPLKFKLESVILIT